MEIPGSLKTAPAWGPLGLCVSRDLAGEKPEKSAALEEGLLGQSTHSVAVVQKILLENGLNRTTNVIFKYSVDPNRPRM